MSLVSRTALTVLAGLVAVPMTPMTRTSPSPGAHPVSKAAPVAYTASHKEFYLAADQLAFGQVLPELLLDDPANDLLEPLDVAVDLAKHHRRGRANAVRAG